MNDSGTIWLKAEDGRDVTCSLWRSVPGVLGVEVYLHSGGEEGLLYCEFIPVETLCEHLDSDYYVDAQGNLMLAYVETGEDKDGNLIATREDDFVIPLTELEKLRAWAGERTRLAPLRRGRRSPLSARLCLERTEAVAA